MRRPYAGRKLRFILKPTTHDYIMNVYVRELCGVSVATTNRILIGLLHREKQQNAEKVVVDIGYISYVISG